MFWPGCNLPRCSVTRFRRRIARRNLPLHPLGAVDPGEALLDFRQENPDALCVPAKVVLAEARGRADIDSCPLRRTGDANGHIVGEPEDHGAVGGLDITVLAKLGRLLVNDLPIQRLNGFAHGWVYVGERARHKERLDVGIGRRLQRAECRLVKNRIGLALPDFRDPVEGWRIGGVGRDLVEPGQVHEAWQRNRRNRKQGQAQEYGKGRLARTRCAFVPDVHQCGDGQRQADYGNDRRPVKDLQSQRRGQAEEAMPNEGSRNGQEAEQRDPHAPARLYGMAFKVSQWGSLRRKSHEVRTGNTQAPALFQSLIQKKACSVAIGPPNHTILKLRQAYEPGGS